MNISLEYFDSTNNNGSNGSIPLLAAAPVLARETDLSKTNITIIQTSNGSLVTADQMFLNTVAAQAISGIFVWAALLITCYQVSFWDSCNDLKFLTCTFDINTVSLHAKETKSLPLLPHLS